MKYTNLIDSIPLYLYFMLTFFVVIGSIFIGSTISSMSRKETSPLLSTLTGAILGLLAFVLAFTFSMAANRFETRKELFLNEVNAISTAYLRAGLLPSPYQGEAKYLIREYVSIRTSFSFPGQNEKNSLKESVEHSETIQNALWTNVEKMTAALSPTVIQMLYIESLNKMIDLHTSRIIVGTQNRIPTTIWLSLYLLTALAMITVGYQFNSFYKNKLVITLLLSLTFSVVFVLITDLDRAGQGTISVNFQPLLELNKKLQADPI